MLSNQSNVAGMPQLLAFTFWRRLLTSVIPSREGYADTLYGYNPYHREPTPEEKLAALAKNQEKEKTQPSRKESSKFHQ